MHLLDDIVAERLLATYFFDDNDEYDDEPRDVGVESLELKKVLETHLASRGRGRPTS